MKLALYYSIISIKGFFISRCPPFFFWFLFSCSPSRIDQWHTARDPGLGSSYYTREDLPFYYSLYDNFAVMDNYQQVKLFIASCEPLFIDRHAGVHKLFGASFIVRVFVSDQLYLISLMVNLCCSVEYVYSH